MIMAKRCQWSLTWVICLQLVTLAVCCSEIHAQTCSSWILRNSCCVLDGQSHYLKLVKVLSRCVPKDVDNSHNAPFFAVITLQASRACVKYADPYHTHVTGAAPSREEARRIDHVILLTLQN